jgi:hypothetical protein
MANENIRFGQIVSLNYAVKECVKLIENKNKSNMKYCKGNGQALNYGCGNQIEQSFKYGLCKPCYAHWLYKTPKGLEKLNTAQKNAQKQHADKLAKLYNPNRKKYTKIADMDMNRLKIATQRVCNQYIRLRDEINHGICISSERKINDAGHFFSIGSNQSLRFSPQNIHGQNARDNRFNGANLLEYEKGLRLRYGYKYVEELYDLNGKLAGKKVLTRDYVLRVNLLYKELAKSGKWIFRHEEFEKLLNTVEL